MKQKVIVVTGGAGYIGNHVVHNLLAQNFEVIIIDDLSNGDSVNVNPLVKLLEGDFSDSKIWDQIADEYIVNGVIHLAAFIEVDESFQKPNDYLLNNAIKTGELLNILHQHEVNNLAFASTCGVYGKNQDIPLTENILVEPLNPYAASKALAEQSISYAAKYFGLNAIIFRFFNTCGTLADINIRPNNQTALLSQIRLVKDEQAQELKIFGNQFATKDGTCIRDYVHVYDVARACVSGIQALINNQKKFEIYNIGSEQGYSVQEVIDKTEQLFDTKLNVKVVDPRPDEVVVSVASSQKLQNDLNFEFKYSDLENILKTSLT